LRPLEAAWDVRSIQESRAIQLPEHDDQLVTGATARVAASVMGVFVHLHNLPKRRMLTQPTATRNVDLSEAAVADLIALTNRSRNS
jgi:hypothetical protein